MKSTELIHTIIDLVTPESKKEAMKLLKKLRTQVKREIKAPLLEALGEIEGKYK